MFRYFISVLASVLYGIFECAVVKHCTKYEANKLNGCLAAVFNVVYCFQLLLLAIFVRALLSRELVYIMLGPVKGKH